MSLTRSVQVAEWHVLMTKRQQRSEAGCESTQDVAPAENVKTTYEERWEPPPGVFNFISWLSINKLGISAMAYSPGVFRD